MLFSIPFRRRRFQGPILRESLQLTLQICPAPLNEVFDLRDPAVEVRSGAGPALAVQRRLLRQIRFIFVQDREKLFRRELVIEQLFETSSKLRPQLRFAEKTVGQPVPAGDSREAARPEQNG